MVGGLVVLVGQAGHPGLHLRPGDLAALHGEQRLAPVADVDGERARAQQVAGGLQQPQQVHRVLPARGAVRADVGVEFAALALRVAGERLVGAAGEERVAQGQQFTARGVGVLHER